jgi:type IV fimbrial biogenesis protein FimT
MRCRGYSLVELLVSIALASLLAGFAVPAVLGAREGVRALGAADYVANMLHLARLEALRRHANVAVRFEPDVEGYRLAFYADGNGDGVRSAQVESGTDFMIRGPERLEDQFPGVTFGLDEQVGPIDPGDRFSDRDPIKVGRSRMLSFSPAGTCTPGTLYVLGRGRRQLAVRVLGATGRLRVLEFNFGTLTWRPR